MIGLNTKVKRSAKYRECFPASDYNRQGTVVGFTRNREGLYVVWNGNKPSTREAYHLSFVEPIEGVV